MTTETRPRFWPFGLYGMATKVALKPSKPRGRSRDPERDELSAARGIGLAVMLSCAMILLVVELVSNFWR